MNQNEIFHCEGEVRDNETDFQGIVNNAQYFVYMAFARHKHLQALGIDIAKLHEEGFDLVLFKSEIDFVDSLRPWDHYIVTSRLEKEGRLKVVFLQEVIRAADQKVVTRGRNIGVCINRYSRRPSMPPVLQRILGL